MKKLFIRYLYHGVLMSNLTVVPTHEHTEEAARRLVPEGHKPFGFAFITRERAADELDSRETYVSPTHYFGGEVLTLDEVKARNNPRDEILISNMECNRYDRVIMLGGQAFVFPLDAVLLEPLA